MDYAKEDEKVLARLRVLDQEILHELQHFKDKYIGRYVRITSGWRKKEKGARAIIDSVLFDCSRVLFLCMAVNKKDEKINGDAWTREFRSITDFELWEQPDDQR